MPQLWLSVLEDHVGSTWPPTLETADWRVSLSYSGTLQECNHPIPFRTSPVFPLSDEFVPPQPDDDDVFFLFLCFDPAFPVLARLIENAPPELRSGVLFTLGLASVVLVTHAPISTDDLHGLCGAEPRVSELWHVKKSRIVEIRIAPGAPSIFDSRRLQVHPHDSLPLPAKTTVDEFVSSIGMLMPKVALHLPGEIDTFFSIVELADELVIEMVYSSNPKGMVPDSLSDYTEDQFKSDPSLGAMILHQATDRLIQINAALSYLSTQALSGAVPILERRSLIRRYSLLGVGTAVLALTRVARSIERAFASGAVETILADQARYAAALPGLDNLPEYDPTNWRKHSVNIWKGKVSARPTYPKLPYFSGRLGFRESEYTISAALQSLAAGGGSEWSFLTITHEMVHGHVRNILSIILHGDPHRLPDARFAEFHRQLVDHLEGRSATTDSETLLDSLRIALLSYCCMTLTNGSLTREGDRTPNGHDVTVVRVGFGYPNDPALLLSLLEAEFRNISEILVHVLDLHYFYLSRLSAYIPLIWRSWSTLPQVRGDLRQYLLRSILAAATKTTGSPYERFGQSRVRVRELLAPLSSLPSSGASTIQAALGVLDDDREFEKLFFAFHASLILVDVADHVLTADVIRGSLNGGDRHVRIRADPSSFEEWFEYDIPDGFVDTAVVAPTAYLAHRLAKKVSAHDAATLESETVTLFLACCSHIAN